jgi:5-methylcytosine-specific restriction endonuclease McrA
VRLLIAALALALACATPSAVARSHGRSHYSTTTSSHSYSKAAPGAQRDSHGKIKRSGQAKDDFKKSHPCPSTGKTYGSCPGYVIDHLIPLKRGGADAPYNMQWQTTQTAKQKDKWE